MPRVEISQDGKARRAWDQQRLKTKIVATIGSVGEKGSYSKNDFRGIYDLEGNLRKAKDIDYYYLISNFIRHGVDVIRLNMAHMKRPKIQDPLGATKEFFQSLSKIYGSARSPKIAVLTDLEGPRITFQGLPKKGIPLREGSEFTLYLASNPSKDMNGASICINERPLKQYYSPDAFKKMMDEVEDAQGPVLVIVGDGPMQLKVKRVDRQASTLRCEVVKGGKIENHKRFTIKDMGLDIRSFTDEDRRMIDLLFDANAFQLDGLWAFVGLSFTQSADDILRVKYYLEDKVRKYLREKRLDPDLAPLYTPAVIAKIETASGFDKREEILDVADGLMVARGDLGVQKEIQEIAAIQKELIKLCNKHGKPVITATEMLKSMVINPEPTRAEVLDVFNAILDGTDAVMLSEETSQGCYPFHAIRKMAEIAAEAEYFFEKRQADPAERRAAAVRRYEEFLSDAERVIAARRTRIDQQRKTLSDNKGLTPDSTERRKLEWMEKLYEGKRNHTLKQRTTNHISQSACIISESTIPTLQGQAVVDKEVKAIIALTTTGRTARMISRFRPTAVIIGATHDAPNACKLLLSYGVIPINIGEVPKKAGPTEMFKQAAQAVLNEQLLGPEAAVVMTSGHRPKEPGTTSTLQIREQLRELAPGLKQRRASKRPHGGV